MQRLPNLSNLDYIIDAARFVDGALGGIVFHYMDYQLPLVIAAHGGIQDPFVAHQMTIKAGDGSASGEAIAQRHRVVIRDTVVDPVAGLHHDASRRAGIRAITATPLVSAQHRMLGVLSLFYSEPHHPSPEALELIDKCAGIAIHLMEVNRLSAKTRSADLTMGMPHRALSPVAAHAAEASRALLPTLGTIPVAPALLDSAARHLQIVADELANNLKHHLGRSPKNPSSK